MDSQRIKGTVGADGVLRLEVPIGVPNKEGEVIVVYEPSEYDSRREGSIYQ
jgi:hypothetical protein